MSFVSHSIGETKDQITKELFEVAQGNASHEARLLLEFVLGLDWTALWIKRDEEISEEAKKRIDDLVKMRRQEYPLAYLLKEQFFYRSLFYVDERVLIPRGDSEVLIETLLKRFKTKEQDDLNFLDLGTGSGCLGLSLALEFPNSQIIMVDKSEKALEVARINGKKVGVELSRLHFLKEDLRNPESFNRIQSQIEGKLFDAVVANPPYISKWATPKGNKNLFISSEVEKHEPHSALFSGDLGVEDWLIWLEESLKVTSQESFLFFEFGDGQKEILEKKLLTWNPSLCFEFIKDNGGRFRICEITKK